MIKNIFRGIFASTITAIVQVLAIFFTTHLIIKYLNPQYASAWFLFYSISQLLYIFDFGTSPTLAREISFLSNNKNNNSVAINNLVYNSQGLNLILAIIFFGVLAVAGEVYLFYIYAVEIRPIIMGAFIYFLMGSFFLFLNIPLLAMHYGFGHVFTERTLRSLILIVTTLGLFVFLQFSQDFSALCMIWLLINLTLYIAIRIYTIKKMNIKFFFASFDKNSLKKFFNVSSQQGLISINAWIIFQIGYFIIGYKLGPQYVAQYAPLMQIAMGIITVANLLLYTAIPFISRLYAGNQVEKIKYFIFKFNQWALILTISAAVYLMINSNLLIHFWLGPSFLYIAPALAILLITAILEVNHLSFAANAMACGYLKFVRISFLAAIFSLILAFVFVKIWALIGVALALCIAQIITNNWYAIKVSIKFFNISWSEYFKNLVSVLVYTTGLLIIVAGLYFLDLGKVEKLLVSTLLIGGYFGALMFILFKKDLTFVRQRMITEKE